MPGTEQQRTQRGIAALKASRFAQQRAFIDDAARQKVLLTTRRAGKTASVPAYLLESAAGRKDDAVATYMTLTRKRAKHLAWRPLLAEDKRYGLGLDLNRAELTAQVPGGGLVVLAGAGNATEPEKSRGDKTSLAIIDECQSFPASTLKTLVEDALGPALEDVGGTLCLMGTPGPVCSGYWYELTRPEVTLRTKGWSFHRWGVLDNPFMAHMKRRLPEILAERGWTEDHPTYRREWLGEWVPDSSALFYAFEEGRNLHDRQPDDLRGEGWRHVLGWDLGHDDAMAVGVWAFHENLPGLWEAFSWKRPGALVDEVAAIIKSCVAKFQIVGMAADTGGGGKMFVEEVKRRHGLTFVAAEKTAKAQYVAMMNSEMSAGIIKFKRGSPYAEEIAILPKALDGKPGKHPTEDPRYANHCCDQGLYAWRLARHYQHETTTKKPKEGTPEWNQQFEEELIERLKREALRQHDEF